MLNKKKIYKSCFVCVLLFHQCVHTQISIKVPTTQTKKVTIKSRVVDTQNEPIPFANIVFINLETENKIGVISNEADGTFTIELPSGDYILEVSVLGYSKHIKKYTFTADTLLADIILYEQNEQLDEVLIKADISKNIKHSATSMTVNIQNDSLYKKISTADILTLLPGVQLDEEDSVKLKGESATITIDGKRQKMSTKTLMMLLKSIPGDQLKNIELINTPSAKHSGRLKKIIDINLKKQRKDGLLGSLSTMVINADLAIGASAIINYKTGKFIFSGMSNPYSYSKRSTKAFVDRQLLDNSLSFIETQENIRESRNGFNQFGVDYAINKKHSVSATMSLNNGSNDNNTDFTTHQFAFNTLTNQQFNTNSDNMQDKSYDLDFAYRYDIGEQGTRLDFASSYGFKKADYSNWNESELIDILNNTTSNNTNRDAQEQENTQYSSRLDYATPLKDKKGKFEAGIKFDDLKITDANRFESFDADANAFETNPNFTNAFMYNEQVYTSYASFNANHKKLKYSLGLRLEHVETQSFSETTNQTFHNAFTNFLPVVALKYMTNKKETSDINLSYRKGYSLPPYIQLNPFESFVNSNTIKRGNPELSQSIYHLFSLGHNIKNKYFLTLNANFYNNLFQTTQILEDELTIISYKNLGTRSLYKTNLSSSFTLFPWWRFNINQALSYSVLKNEDVDNKVFSWYTNLANSFTLPHDVVLRLSTYISNGDSNGLDSPNSFIRVNTNLSLSKRFLKNKASAQLGIADIFGVSNRIKSTAIIDNTSYSKRVSLQRPIINFNLSYNFSAGKKIKKKNKKSSGVDSSRF